MSSEQTQSHSAVFGLEPQNKPTENAGSGPGSGIEGTTGVKGHKNTGTETSNTGLNTTDHTVAGISGGSSGAERPGAGSSVLTPSQGSNKEGDESGGILDKLNPLK